MIDDNENEPTPGPTPANDSDSADDAPALSPEERIAALETELAEAKDRVLRTLADTENTRRRLQREREEAQKYAVSGFAKDLLGAADNLRRALEAIPDAEVTDSRTRSLLDGVAATERELLAAFERHGLKRIDAKGERFDHNFHQAIFEAERPGAAAGTVIEVLQPGYVLHERLLRPAMVGVAKGSAAPPADSDTAA